MLFLEAPESIEEKGGYVPGGLLLWGPPGTGKTLMAEAVAGETGKPFVFVDPGAFINMFMGVGILKVKSLFRKLRKLAVRYGGVIVFFDEADALGSRGAVSGGMFERDSGPWATEPACNGMAYLSHGTVSALRYGGDLPGREPIAPARRGFIMGGMGGGGGGMGTLQALLTELSGLKKPRGFINRYVRRALGMRPKPPPKYRILVMMATNMPDALDEALLRPGRIDRIYKVGYPSKPGRKRTFEGYLAKVQHQLSDAEIDKIATISPYATGATIKDTVNEALVIAIRDGRETITFKDMLRAKQMKEHGLADDSEYIDRERHAVAVHEACHAVVAYRMMRRIVLDMATIERRGDIGGFVSWIDPEDLFTHWRSDREGDIMTSLASLVGERLFFEGDNTNGVTGDLRSATTVATMMEAYWGMGSTIGSHAVTKFGLTHRRSQYALEDGLDRNLLETELGRRVEQRLNELYERTDDLLRENHLEVLAVAHALETHKTMSGEDVVAIIEGTMGPTVDGRPYHAPEFRDVAEAYHAGVLEAHKGTGKVKVPLPVFNGHAPQFAAAGAPEAWVLPSGNGDPWELPGETIDPRPPVPQSEP
jgi:ATP-dependent Zn protease